MVGALAPEYYRGHIVVKQFLDGTFAEFNNASATSSAINIDFAVGSPGQLNLTLQNPDNTLNFSPNTPIGITVVSVSPHHSASPASNSISLFQGFVVRSTKAMDNTGMTTYNIHCMDRSFPLTQKYPTANQYAILTRSIEQTMEGFQVEQETAYSYVNTANNYPNGLLYRTGLAYSGPANILPTTSAILGHPSPGLAWPQAGTEWHTRAWSGSGFPTQSLTDSAGVAAFAITDTLSIAPFGRAVIDVPGQATANGGTTPVLFMTVEDSLLGTTISTMSITASYAAGSTISFTLSVGLTASRFYTLRWAVSGSGGAGFPSFLISKSNVTSPESLSWRVRSPGTFSADIERDYFNRQTAFEAMMGLQERLPGQFMFPNSSSTISFLAGYTHSGASFTVGSNVERWSIQEPMEASLSRIIVIPNTSVTNMYEFRDPNVSNFNADDTSSKTKIINSPAAKNRQETQVWAYSQLQWMLDRQKQVSFDINGWSNTNSYLGAIVTLSHLGTNYIGRCTGERHVISPDGIWRKTIELNGDDETSTKLFMETILESQKQTEETTGRNSSSEYLILIPKEYRSAF